MTFPTKKLGEICDLFTDGDWIETKDQSSEGIRLVQTGNIGQGVFKDRGEKARYISEKTFKRLNCTEVLPGDILISRLPDPVGRACIVPEVGKKMITAVDCTIVRLNEHLILSKFFNYFAQSNKYLREVKDKTTGTTRERISRKNLGLIDIPIPSIPEQKRIVKILDEVFEGIAKAKENTEKNLRNSRELFESTLESAFTDSEDNWELAKLEDVCRISSKLVDPREKMFVDLPHVGGANIESRDGNLINLQTAREEKLKSGKFVFDEGMVLYSKIRPYLMKVARPNFSGLCSADIYPLSPESSKIIRDYLFYLLLTSDFTQYAIKGSGRAGMPKVNREHLFEYGFSLPPLKTQKLITSKLDSLASETKKLEAIYQHKLNDLEELKKSVLKKAFSGEL